MKKMGIIFLLYASFSVASFDTKECFVSTIQSLYQNNDTRSSIVQFFDSVVDEFVQQGGNRSFEVTGEQILQELIKQETVGILEIDFESYDALNTWIAQQNKALLLVYESCHVHSVAIREYLKGYVAQAGDMQVCMVQIASDRFNDLVEHTDLRTAVVVPDIVFIENGKAWQLPLHELLYAFKAHIDGFLLEKL